MFGGGVGKHSLNRRLANGATYSLEKDKNCGNWPVSRKYHGGNGEQVYRVADERDSPVSPRLIGNVTGDGAQGITEKFPEASGDADGQGTCSEQRHELAVDAPASLIRHVTEEIDDAHHEHEGESGRSEVE